MAKVRSNRLYGAVELLVLRTLEHEGPAHGLDVARRIAARSDDTLKIEEGALYPALHRLQERGLVEGEWQVSDRGRRARVYQVTEAGREELRRETESWVRHTAAIRRVLGIAEEEVG